MKRENLIKIGVVVIAVALFSFSDWSFAAEDSDELVRTIGEGLYLIVSVLSWIWVFFAKGAGEFLTNKWVYGEAIGLDVILWQYRNVVKNMANFGLGFYFVYVVGKGVLSISGVDKIKDKLVWLLVAGVGIQASWFMTAVVIDISTITLSAAGSFPSMLMSQSTDIKDSLDTTFGNFLESGKKLGNEITKGKKISLFLPNMGQADFISITTKDLKEGIKKEEFYDTLMPSAESVSGPLYYLGFAILKTPTLVSPDAIDENGRKSTILNVLLQGGTTILFSIEMLVLLIFSVMRMVYLWVFIVLSPIVVLLKCIEAASGGKDLGFMGDFIKSLKEHFDFKPFFWNTFKPTLIVLGFSLSMIFVSLVSSIIISEGQDFDMGGVQTKNSRNGGNTGDGEGNYKYDTVFDGENAEILIKSGGKSLFDVILCIMTIILIYRVIKFAVNMGGGKDFVSDKIGKFQKNVEEDITSLPLVPVPGRDEKTGESKTRTLSIGKVFGLGRDEGKGNIFNQVVNRFQTKANNEYNRQEAIFDSWVGDETGYLNVDQVSTIETAMTTGSYQVRGRLGKAKAEIDRIKQGAEKGTGFGMTLSRDTAKNNGFWLNQFGQRLTDMKNETVTGTKYDFVWNSMIKAWNSSQTTDIEKKLEEIFKDQPDRIKAYADFFGLGNITTWEELKVADISKK